MARSSKLAHLVGEDPIIIRPDVLVGGTVEVILKVRTKAEDKVRLLTQYYKNPHLFPEATGPPECTITREDCLTTGKPFDKYILTYRPGQKGAGTLEHFTTCPGVRAWAERMTMLVNHSKICVFAQAVYSGHCPGAPNEYN